MNEISLSYHISHAAPSTPHSLSLRPTNCQLHPNQNRKHNYFCVNKSKDNDLIRETREITFSIHLLVASTAVPSSFAQMMIVGSAHLNLYQGHVKTCRYTDKLPLIIHKIVLQNAAIFHKTTTLLIMIDPAPDLFLYPPFY